MKIVYEAALHAGSGGGPRHFEGLGGALARQGEVTFVVPSNTAVEVERLPGSVEQLRTRSTHPILRNLEYELARTVRILRWFLTGRRFDVWVSRHAPFGVGLAAARLVARTVVLEVNGPAREEILANGGTPWMARVVDLALRVQLRAAHLVAPVTEGLRGYVTGRSGTPAVVIANGAEPASGSSGHRAEPVDLVFVGAFTPWYDLDTVLRAVASLRDDGQALSCRLVGDGQSRGRVETLIGELDLVDQVTLTGWVGSDQAIRQMREARVGLLPLAPKTSNTAVVGSPLKLYEYAAHGLAVVSTELDGVVDSPLSAWVQTYSPGSVEECTAAIRTAIEAPKRMAPVHLWSWDGRARRLLDEIASLHAEQPRRRGGVRRRS